MADVWVLRQRSNSKTHTFASWDGPPSPAYVRYTPEALEVDKAKASDQIMIERLEAEVERLKEFKWKYEDLCK